MGSRIYNYNNNVIEYDDVLSNVIPEISEKSAIQQSFWSFPFFLRFDDQKEKVKNWEIVLAGSYRLACDRLTDTLWCSRVDTEGLEWKE